MQHLRTTLVLVLLTSALGGLAPVASAARSNPPPTPLPATTSTPRQAAPDCTSSPFGGQLVLGGERELFVGYNGGFGTATRGWLLNDRYDLGAANQVVRSDAWPPTGQTPEAALRSVAEPAVTAADLDGDGKDALVQLFKDASGALRVGVFGATSPAFYDLKRTNLQKLAIATGNPTRRVDQRRGVVIAYQATTDGSLNVLMPFVKDDGTLSDVTQTLPATWSSSIRNRGNAEIIRLAMGDLNSDGFADEIVVALKQPGSAIQLIVLRYNGTTQLQEIAFRELGLGTPFELQVATGDVDARHRAGEAQNFSDEIVVAANSFNRATPGLSEQLGVYTFALGPEKNQGGDAIIPTIQDRGTWTTVAAHSDLSLATGDTDGDGRAEPVVGYRSYGNNNPLVIWTLDAQQPTIRPHNQLTTFDNNRSAVASLSLAVGDLDRDGQADIAAAFRDTGNQLQLLRVSDPLTATDAITDVGVITPSLRLQIVSSVRDGATGRTGLFGITLATGDADGDSLKAVYAPAYGLPASCRAEQEPNLVAAIFPPPYWQRLQGGRARNALLGKSASSGGSTETNLSTSSTHSVSFYAGAEVGGSLGPIEAEASLQAKGGYAYTTATGSGGSLETRTTVSQEYSNDDPFVVVQRARHTCYTYQLRQGATTLDGAARFCEDRGHDTISTDLGTWNSDYAPVSGADALQWSPIGRDWASLTLFRNATQSSTDGANAAARAVDGDTGDRSAAQGVRQSGARLAGNTVSSTRSEPNPWWQVDLGLAQDLSALRLWHRDNYDCGAQTCAKQLGAFYVFVSETDMSTISNDPNVLKNDPRVRTYERPFAAPLVTNIQTLDKVGDAERPLRARYVRVQLAGTGALSLAEVQAFGARHIDPDRYPVWVRDPDATEAITTGNRLAFKPGTDGWFEVGVHAPDGTVKPVRMRGNLLWSARNALREQINPGRPPSVNKVSKGDTTYAWSMESERNESLSRSEEIEHSVSVGVEAEVKGGVGVKVVVGGGYENTVGLFRASTNSVAWGESIVIGGGVQGFPATLDGNPLSLEALRPCEYAFEPFYYEAAEESTVGYAHRFVLVDSVVPDFALDRSANLSICQAPRSTTPTLASNVATGAPGSSFIMTASGFPNGARATLALKAPLDVDYRTLTTLTMKANGELVFVLATRPNDNVGDYSVRLTVEQASGARATTLAATTSLTLRAGAPIVTAPPSDNPLVSTDPARPGGRSAFLPLLRR